MKSNAKVVRRIALIALIVALSRALPASSQQSEVVVTQVMVPLPDSVRSRFEALLAREETPSQKAAGNKPALADSLLSLLEVSLATCITSNLRLSPRDLAARPGHGYLIHLATWDGEAIDKERWYVYDKGDGWVSVRPTRMRLFGRREVTLLYLQVEAPSDPTYKVKITQKREAPLQSLQAVGELALTVLGRIRPAGPPPPLKCGGRQIAMKQPSDIAVSVEIAPQSAKNPTDDSAAAAATLQSVSQAKVDNEGLYWWDVSVGLPLSKVTQLRYNSDDGTVRTEEIDKQNLLALINIFPFKTDTKEMRLQPPHLLAGIAIAEKPLDRFFVGVAVGLNISQAFVGYDFTKRQVPSTLTTGETATPAQLKQDLRSFYKGKVILGLNVPVRQVLQTIQGQ